MSDVDSVSNDDGVLVRGESLTTTKNQMKLVNTIGAAAAVITFCIGSPLPAEARGGGGWVYLGENSNGGSNYYKPERCRGNFCYVKKNYAGHVFATSYDCSSWRYHNTGGHWRDIMPESISEYISGKVCR